MVEPSASCVFAVPHTLRASCAHVEASRTNCQMCCLAHGITSELLTLFSLSVIRNGNSCISQYSAWACHAVGMFETVLQAVGDVIAPASLEASNMGWNLFDSILELQAVGDLIAQACLEDSWKTANRSHASRASILARTSCHRYVNRWVTCD